MQVTVVLLTMLVSCAHAQTTQDCPLNWNTFDQHCYKFVSNPTLTYEESDSTCKTNGAALVSVNSINEHAFITQYLNTWNTIRRIGWWTSGTYIKDSSEQYNLKWEGDGSLQDPTITFWFNSNDDSAAIHVQYIYSGSSRTFGWSRQYGSTKSGYICEIPKTEVHRFIQDARDITFGTSLTDPALAEFGPRFDIQPQNLVVTDRSTETHLECLAKGNPQPTYRWYKLNDDKSLGPVIQPSEKITLTNGKLTFTLTSDVAEGGFYQCEARNKFGSILSNIIQITRGYLNEFPNVQPGQNNAKLYQGTFLNCNPPRYAPAATFQWQKGRVFLQPLLNNYYFMSASGNLYFSEVQSSDGGLYKCIITLAAGPDFIMTSQQPASETSLGIPLHVMGDTAADFPPQIHNDFPAVHPTRPLRGMDITIECLAYGRLPLTYSWIRKDRPMSPKVYFRDLNRVLVIPNVEIDDEGTYTCIVKGRSQTDTKDFTLSIAVKPYFVSPLRDLRADIDSDLTWRCEAIGQPRARITWYRNSTMLQSIPGEMEITSNVLRIFKLNPSRDNGMYQCSADNTYGYTFTGAQLKVMAIKPTFVKSPLPVSMSASIGGNVTIPCKPEAAPTPEIKWLRNSGQIGGGSGVEILNNGYLKLSRIAAGMDGIYTCEATNTYGVARSSTKLSLLSELVFFKYPRDKTEVGYNNTAFIECEASYDYQQYDLVYLWKFNGYPIDMTKAGPYTLGTSNNVKGLYISHATFIHGGSYECIAETTMSSISASGLLEVIGPPGEPAGVYADKSSRSPTTIQLKWTRSPEHGSPILYYSIEAKTAFNPEWMPVVKAIPDQDAIMEGSSLDNYKRTWLVTNLKPFNDYSFRVRARNSFPIPGDYSLPSESYNLPGAAPVVAPHHITWGNGTVGTLTIIWQPLSPEERGGSNIGYNVYWREKGSTAEFAKEIVNNFKDGDNPQVVKVVGEDHFYLPYEVMVGAFNEHGKGPNSTRTIVYSAEGMPTYIPTNVNGQEVNATAITVWWDPVPNSREQMMGQVQGFQITVYDQDQIVQVMSSYVYGYVSQANVIGLEPNNDYWVEVQVFNTAGESNPSERQRISTYLSAPMNYPEYVNITSHGPDSVAFTWRGVSTGLIEEPILGYKIEYWPRGDNYLVYKTHRTGKETNAVIYGIKKDTLYNVRVLGYSRGGDGKKSPTQYFTLGGHVAVDPKTSEIIAGSDKMSSSLFLLISTCFLKHVFL